MILDLPDGWRNILAPELAKPYFIRLREYIDAERESHAVYPPESDVFSAFRLSDFGSTRVVIIGQDPYHDAGQAHGLCFSVRPGVPAPPSLKNIFKERLADTGLAPPSDGCLISWANQGILMLNTVLTVRAHAANSHKGKGWEFFTDAAISALSIREQPVVFVLWGKHSQRKRMLIDCSRHIVIEAAHPSPLSAHNGFFGSRPFSRINEAFRELGYEAIDWRLPADK